MKLIDILVQELPKLGGWPEWATQCLVHDGCYGVVFYDADGYFSKYPDFPKISIDWKASNEITATREQYEAALAASNPEWDGKGLPPVGCECEWQDKNTKAWLPVVIAYSSEWVTVVRELRPLKVGDAVECCINNFGEEERLHFRPIRSEADKKRDEAAKGLIEYLDKETDIDNVFSIKEVIGFYDAIAAGKIPHIRID